jgi:hypothetical protein
MQTKDPNGAVMADRQMVNDTMKYMSNSDFKSYITFCKYKRKKIVNEIRKIFDEREKAIKEKNEDTAKGMKTFDVITIGWLRDLMKARGYGCGE